MKRVANIVGFVVVLLASTVGAQDSQSNRTRTPSSPSEMGCLHAAQAYCREPCAVNADGAPSCLENSPGMTTADGYETDFLCEAKMIVDLLPSEGLETVYQCGYNAEANGGGYVVSELFVISAARRIVFRASSSTTLWYDIVDLDNGGLPELIVAEYGYVDEEANPTPWMINIFSAHAPPVPGADASTPHAGPFRVLYGVETSTFALQSKPQTGDRIEIRHTLTVDREEVEMRQGQIVRTPLRAARSNTSGSTRGQQRSTSNAASTSQGRARP